MEANGAPFTPVPLSVLRFTGIQSYGYTDQRKVETDVEVTEDLSLRKPRTSQLSHPAFNMAGYGRLEHVMCKSSSEVCCYRAIPVRRPCLGVFVVMVGGSPFPILSLNTSMFDVHIVCEQFG